MKKFFSDMAVVFVMFLCYLALVGFFWGLGHAVENLVLWLRSIL